MAEKIKIGISACLIGFKYRYDGDSRTSSAIIEKLRDKVDFVPVCPEVESGFPVPRPKMHLERTAKGTRLVVTDTREDVTRRMEQWAENKLEQLQKRGIAGFIFQTRSPSCGIASTKVRDASGRIVSEAGFGIFARMLRQRFPKMPVAEEKDLDEFIRSLNLK